MSKVEHGTKKIHLMGLGSKMGHVVSKDKLNVPGPGTYDSLNNAISKLAKQNLEMS